MCGRYTLTDVNGRRIAQRWEFDERGIDPDTLGRFNVCPTESVLAVTSADGEAREARALRWGLVPRSAAAVGKGAQPINVRSETALYEPLVRLAARARVAALPDPGRRLV